MNTDREGSLDKWLQKNVSHSSDTPQNKKPSFNEGKSSQKSSEKPSEDKQSSKFRNADRKDRSRPRRRKRSSGNRHQTETANQNNQQANKPISQPANQQISQKTNKPSHGKPTLKIIPLGGLNEVGKNMMAIEYGNDMVVIDMGLQFPEEDMLGVDYIVPDITYIQENAHKLRGILITHGHLDHIGGIPYISKQLQNPTFYGLPLTLGLIEKNIKEYGLKGSTKLIKVKPREKIRLGSFNVMFFRVNHSIPDSCGIIIETPEGIVVHTGDFKFDFTPADGIPADMEMLKWLGTQNVLALLSDSTNSTKPGHTVSEKVVSETLDEIIANTEGRIIIASFSSLIGRMQQLFNSAQKHKRKVFVSGRSMVDNIAIATKLGYLKYPKDLVKPLNRAKKEALKPNALILTTGSQGESMSALTRMALNEHKHVKITNKDTVIFSSNPIVGNERSIISVVNELYRKGAKVINNKAMDVHTTGHGQQEDLRLMLNLVKPKYLVPVHGEYYMRAEHKNLAIGVGIPADNIILADNGSIVEGRSGNLYLSDQRTSANYIMVDNQSGGLSGIASHIISERQAMAYNGVVIINLNIDKNTQNLKSVNVDSHGFIFMKETERILGEVKTQVEQHYSNIISKNKSKKLTKDQIQAALVGSANRAITNKIERRPLMTILVNEV